MKHAPIRQASSLGTSPISEGDPFMDVDSEEHISERAEIHFLAALVDELMKSLHVNGIMTREQLQRIEDAASARIGTEPRAW
jgi:hypothetical protein